MNSRSSVLLRVLWILVILLGPAVMAFAQGGTPSLQVPSISVQLGGAKGGDQVSTSLQILALLTILSLAPALLILTTAFTRIVIILSFLRQAIGTPTIPPNQVIVGLSLFLTFYVMGPTYQEVYTEAVQPYFSEKPSEQISFDEALKRAEKPIREFMLRNTYSKDLRLFLDLRGEEATRETVSIFTLIPAFILSELKTAFIVGFYLFLPFLIIDLIVASGLMSLGMMMLPPTVVSLPAKILVFVLADGWTVLVSAILTGFR